jgi:hypothetical protein
LCFHAVEHHHAILLRRAILTVEEERGTFVAIAPENALAEGA